VRRVLYGNSPANARTILEKLPLRARARGTPPAPRNLVSRAPPAPLSGPIAHRPSSASQNHAGLLR